MGEFASDAEQQVVRDVAAARSTSAGSERAFDTLGVKSFQALTAPMLVDSYALENAVIESGITEEMMKGLDELGVVGLGVLPDGLRKPIGVTAPILGPADWRGITFGTLSRTARPKRSEPSGPRRRRSSDGARGGHRQGRRSRVRVSIWVHQATRAGRISLPT